MSCKHLEHYVRATQTDNGIAIDIVSDINKEVDENYE